MRVESYQCNLCEKRTISKENMAGIRVSKVGGKHIFSKMRLDRTDTHMCRECTIGFYEYVSNKLKQEEKVKPKTVTIKEVVQKVTQEKNA